MIEVVDLEKRYDSVVAVKGVSFSINAGEVVGLLGPNGAGKTTIMKILTCFHYPSSGLVTIKGFDVHTQALEIKRLLGYLPENAPVYTELTVREYLEFIAATRLGKGKTSSGFNSKEAVERAVEACGVKDKWLHAIETLSKGYRQRVGLAQAILHDPEFLILDEPTTGLDPNQILEIRHLIQKLGKSKTVIVSTHILQEVEAVCNRVLILNKGHIVAQGTTQEIGNELRGGWNSKLRVKGSGEAFIKKLPGFSAKVSLVSKSKAAEAGYTDLELTCPRDSAKSQDIFHEMLFDAVVQTGEKLVSLMPVNTSLEDVFISLTTDNKSEVRHE